MDIKKDILQRLEKIETTTEKRLAALEKELRSLKKRLAELELERMIDTDHTLLDVRMLAREVAAGNDNALKEWNKRRGLELEREGRL